MSQLDSSLTSIRKRGNGKGENGVGASQAPYHPLEHPYLLDSASPGSDTPGRSEEQGEPLRVSRHMRLQDGFPLLPRQPLSQQQAHQALDLLRKVPLKQCFGFCIGGECR